MRTLLALSVVLAAACAAGGPAGGGGNAAAAVPRRSENVITQEELRTTGSSSLYDAVRVLRPSWFRFGPTTLRPQAEGTLVVYVDRARLGDARSLNEIRTADVAAVRYYSPSEAQAEFGPGHLHGAIQVFTARAR